MFGLIVAVAGTTERKSSTARRKLWSGERRLLACSRRQLADDAVVRRDTLEERVTQERFSASCRKGQAGSLCSPEIRVSLDLRATPRRV